MLRMESSLQGQLLGEVIVFLLCHGFYFIIGFSDLIICAVTYVCNSAHRCTNMSDPYECPLCEAHSSNQLPCPMQILMIRLGSLTCLDCSIRLSWLELLHNYFQELLRQPLTHFLSDQDDCLEGSPFLLSLSDGEACGVHSSHLQRQAVFLFLDCSFSLICQRGENTDHSIPSTLCSCLTTNPDSELDHFCTKKGLLEVYKWIQGLLPTEISVDHEKYLEICMNFMSSFLQLYLREVCLPTLFMLLLLNS